MASHKHSTFKSISAAGKLFEVGKPSSILKKIKYLLKEQGMTINGVKKLLNNDKSLKLDEFSNNPISVNNIKLRNKLKNISNLVKQIKKLK